MAKLNASRNPTFSTEMEAMERTTPGHYSEWNKRHQQLLDNDQYLKDQKDDEGFSVVDAINTCPLVPQRLKFLIQRFQRWLLHVYLNVWIRECSEIVQRRKNLMSQYIVIWK